MTYEFTAYKGPNIETFRGYHSIKAASIDILRYQNLGWHVDYLINSVTNVVERVIDHDAMKKANQQTREQFGIDPETGQPTLILGGK